MVTRQNRDTTADWTFFFLVARIRHCNTPCPSHFAHRMVLKVVFGTNRSMAVHARTRSARSAHNFECEFTNTIPNTPNTILFYVMTVWLASTQAACQGQSVYRVDVILSGKHCR